MPKTLTLRSISTDLERRLEAESERRGESIEAVVLRVLESAFSRPEKRRDLSKFVDWSQDDVELVDRALKIQRTVDDSFWR